MEKNLKKSTCYAVQPKTNKPTKNRTKTKTQETQEFSEPHLGFAGWYT